MQTSKKKKTQRLTRIYLDRWQPESVDALGEIRRSRHRLAHRARQTLCNDLWMFSLLGEKFAQRFFHLVRLALLRRLVAVVVVASRQESGQQRLVVSTLRVELGGLARRVLVDRVVALEQIVDLFRLILIGCQLGETTRSAARRLRRLLEIDEYDALAMTSDVFVDVVEAEN